MTRYFSLDVLRFVAALGIVFYHCMIYADVMGWQSRPACVENFRLFVDLFFALSGFVMMHVHGDTISTASDFRLFIRKRFARVYPLHALTALIFVTFGYAAAGTAIVNRIDPVLDPGGIMPNLLLLQAVRVLPTLSLDYPSWSVSAEWFVYLAFPLCAVAARRMPPVITFVLAIAIAVVVAKGREWLGLRDWSHATFDFGALRALPSFLAGAAAFKLVRDHPTWRVSWATAVVFGAAVAALMIAEASPALIVALLPGLVAVLAVAERGNRDDSKLAGWLGNVSFAVYLLHVLVMMLSAEIIDAHLRRYAAAGSVLAFLTVAVTLPLAALTFRFYEAPMRRLLSPRRPASERPAIPNGASLSIT